MNNAFFNGKTVKALQPSTFFLYFFKQTAETMIEIFQSSLMRLLLKGRIDLRNRSC